MDKKEIRRLKREAREERAYGNPVLRTIVDYNPQVKRLYNHYKEEKQLARVGGILKWVMLGLGVSSFISDCIMAIQGISRDFTSPSIAVGMGLCWWNYQEIHQMRAERLSQDIIRHTDKESIEKAFNSLVEGEKNGTDKAKKMD